MLIQNQWDRYQSSERVPSGMRKIVRAQMNLIARSRKRQRYGYTYRKDNSLNITKTCLYNFDPLKPHSYIVKLGVLGVYIIFLISAQKIDCGYSLEPPRRGDSNEYPQSMSWAEMWKKYQNFLSENFYFFLW